MMGRGGVPIFTFLGGALFMWWAITRSRPGPSIAGETAEREKLGALERLCWAVLGVALICFGFTRLAHFFDRHN